MGDATWFYQQGGQAVGPISTAELCQKFSSGELSLETLVYGESVKSWTTADRISGFRECVTRTASRAPLAAEPAPGAAVVAMLPPDLSGRPAAPGSAAAAAAADAAAVTTLPGVPTTLPRTDVMATTTPRPWLRLVARSVDSCGFWLLVAGALNYVILPAITSDHDPRHTSLAFLLALLVAEAAAWIVLSAALLSTFGTTPGKWLLGMKVRNESNALPKFGQAILRELGALGLGLGLGFFPLSLLLMLLSYVRLMDQGTTRWDRMLKLHVEQGPCGDWRVAFAMALPIVGYSTIAVGSMAAGLHAAAARHVQVVARSVSLPSFNALPSLATPEAPAPQTIDPRVVMCSGTWVSLTPSRVGTARFTLRNTLTLNDDGTFRQSLRVIDRAGKVHADLGRQCSGTWQLDGDRIVQRVSLSSTPDYPIGTWAYDLLSATGDGMTLRRSVEPHGFVYAGRKPVLQYQRMTATVRAD